MSIGIFVFNNTLRVQNEHLLECSKNHSKIYGVFIGNPNDFVMQVLYLLKKKLFALGIPLYLIDKMPRFKPRTDITVYVNKHSFLKINTNKTIVEFDDMLTNVYTKLSSDFPRHKLFSNFIKKASVVDIDYQRVVIKQRKRSDFLTLKDIENPIIKTKIDHYGKMKTDIRSAIKSNKSNTRLSKYISNGMVDLKGLFTVVNKTSELFLNLMKREHTMRLYEELVKNEDNLIRPKMKKMLNDNDNQYYKKWCDGETGFPLIDASMRCFNETKYLNARRRNLVANFWCKLCLGDLKKGEKYLRGIDYHPGLSIMGWLHSGGYTDRRWGIINNPNLFKYDDNEFIKKWKPPKLEPIFDYKERRKLYLDILKELSK